VDINPTNIEKVFQAAGKRKWSEAAASKQMTKALKELGWSYRRIESGSTHRGIADIYAWHESYGSVWIEMKANDYPVSEPQLAFLREFGNVPRVVGVLVRAETPHRWKAHLPLFDEGDDRGLQDAVFRNPKEILLQLIQPLLLTEDLTAFDLHDNRN
jgi:hypothetical protein